MCFNMIGDNNVFNIRYNKRNKWFGQTGQKHGFCCFDSRDHAIRACFKLLVNYIRSGYDTYRKIINRFAPPSENDTDKYLDFVCSDSNVLIDPDHEVVTYNDLIYLMLKMAKMENGIDLSYLGTIKSLKGEVNFNIYSRIKM